MNPQSSPFDWRYFIYRASDIIKRPLGAYCVQLYRDAFGENEFLIAIKKAYKFRHNDKLTAHTSKELIEEADTRGWFKLIRQNIDGRLRDFVPRKHRSSAILYLDILIQEYNEAYHQQEFEAVRVREALKTTLALLRLIDSNKAAVSDACTALTTLLVELDRESDGERILVNVSGAEHGIIPVAREITVMVDDQMTAPVSPNSIYTLHIVAPDGRAQNKPLAQSELIVGRGGQADVQVDDPQVSRQHVKVTVTPNQISITDLESMHGTFMNNERLASNRAIPWKVGQRVVIGNTLMVLRWTI